MGNSLPSLGYEDFHWPAWREEAGTRLCWRHDAEGRLLEVRNEAGEVYRYTRDELGRVVREEGFDGAAWHYQYDAAGRLAQATQPSGRTRHLTYDEAGRLKRVEYGDGTFHAFGYRADGALVEAENESGKVALARDALGRVVAEKQEDGEVVSRYSPAGHRVEVESSLGAHQKLLRDALGAVKGVTYTSPGRPEEWTVRMECAPARSGLLSIRTEPHGPALPPGRPSTTDTAGAETVGIRPRACCLPATG